MAIFRVRAAVMLCATVVLIVGGWRVAGQSRTDQQEQHIRSIEAKAVDISLGANEPPLQMSLQQLMECTKSQHSASR